MNTIQALNDLLTTVGADRAILNIKAGQDGKVHVVCQVVDMAQHSMSLDDEEASGVNELRAALARPIAFTGEARTADVELSEQLGKLTPAYGAAMQRYSERTTTDDTVEALHKATEGAADDGGADAEAPGAETEAEATTASGGVSDDNPSLL
ncbi:MAG: hypothetical protein LAT62_11265 [Natronospirillum sp.]|uniref:hypothetical protein n=1 Tax=Natronospirillum sp. TaxID=2812955 RepID=UPI0025DD3308|nr:hypothetical protein [Natronospirillum sp.]MCH8552509.1 hypothetical protein [Natronospirillum sp.]